MEKIASPYFSEDQSKENVEKGKSTHSYHFIVKMLFCSGTLSSNRIYNKFTCVKNLRPLEITNIFDFFKQKIFSDKDNTIYQWNIEERGLNDLGKGPSEKNINVNFLKYDSLNNLVKERDQENNSPSRTTPLEENFIIDIKNTKKDVYLLYDDYSLSQMKAEYEQSTGKISFSGICSNIIDREKIVKISCGSNHTMALSNKGVLFAWGCANNGRLGLGKTEDVSFPMLVSSLMDFNILDVSAGLAHNAIIAISKNNENYYDDNAQQPSHILFTWGRGKEGRLGVGTQEDHWVPVRVQFFDNMQVKEASCGYSHTAVLTYFGEVYVFGSNDYGQLGIGQDKNSSLLPKKVTVIRDQPKEVNKENKVIRRDFVEQLHVGPLHMFAITSEGLICSWGLGSHGQLGNEKILVKVHYPKAVNASLNAEADELNEDYEKMFSQQTIKQSLDRIRLFLGFDCTFFLFEKKNSSASLSCADKKSIKSAETVGSDEKKDSPLSNSLELPKQDVFPFKLGDPAPPPTNDENFNKFEQKTEDHSKVLQERKEDNKPSGITLAKQKFKSLIKRDESGNNEKKDEYSKKEDKSGQTKDYGIKKNERNKQVEEQILQKEMRLKKQWVEEIIPLWNEKLKGEQIRNLCYLGIPPSVRSKVWACAIKNDLNITNRYFLIMQERGRVLNTKYQDYKRLLKEQKLSAPSLDQIFNDPLLKKLAKENTIKIIEADLPRTFPSLPIFNSSESPLYQGLQDILLAFSCSRPDIGYIQGMSYIAGMLLLYMDTFSAFVCFSNIVAQPSLLPFFLLDENYINQRVQIFLFLFNNNLPDLCTHFNQLSIHPKMYLIEWFLTLFTKSLNPDVVSRIWDIYFVEGPLILYKAALAVFIELEEQLLDADETGVMKLIKNLSEYITNDERLVKNIKKIGVPSWMISEFDRLEHISSFCY